MPDFRLSLLDADEHLDIKINRFGGSTTQSAVCGKQVLRWGVDCTWRHKVGNPSSEFQLLCAKNLISLSHNYQSNEVLIFTTRFRYQSQEQQLKW